MATNGGGHASKAAWRMHSAGPLAQTTHATAGAGAPDGRWTSWTTGRWTRWTSWTGAGAPRQWTGSSALLRSAGCHGQEQEQRPASTVSVSYTNLKASTGTEHVFAASAKRRSVPKPLSLATAARHLGPDESPPSGSFPLQGEGGAKRRMRGVGVTAGGGHACPGFPSAYDSPHPSLPSPSGGGEELRRLRQAWRPRRGRASLARCGSSCRRW